MIVTLGSAVVGYVSRGGSDGVGNGSSVAFGSRVGNGARVGRGTGLRESTNGDNALSSTVSGRFPLNASVTTTSYVRSDPPKLNISPSDTIVRASPTWTSNVTAFVLV